MRAIHLLISSVSDYLWEYPRFFAANRELLKRHGIAMPWVKNDANGEIWQPNLAWHLKQLADKQEDGRKYLAGELADRQSLLLCGVPGNFWDFSKLAEIVRAIPGWEDAKVHILWLPSPRSRAMEGFYRIFPVRQRELTLRKWLQGNAGGWLEKVESVLRQADTVKIVPDSRAGHLPTHELLAGLQLPAIDELPDQIDDLRFNSPLLQLVARKLEAMLVIDRKTVHDILKPHDAAEMEPLLPTDLLVEYDQRYNQGMEELAAGFGNELQLGEGFPDVEKRSETVQFSAEQWRDAAQIVVNQLQAEKIQVAKRIFNWAPQRMWPGFERIEAGEPALELNVLTMTYNHDKYILECMESVSMQRVDFPMRHIILDDGSNDANRKIIMNYAQSHPHVIPLFLRRPRPGGDNVGCLFEAARSRYVALCEGDDYFTDPLKLQKQVDFMEKNPAFAMSFHPVKVLYEDGKPSRTYPEPAALPNGAPKPFYSIKDLFFGNFIQTNSVVYRWRFNDGLPDWFVPDLIPADWYWHILHAETGLVGFLPETMSVYRRHAAAVFATAEGDHVKHREKYGIQELRLYNTLDSHFKGKFHADLARLADGVLADLLQIYIDSGNDATFRRACDRFPVFGREFLRKLNNVSQ